MQSTDKLLEILGAHLGAIHPANLFSRVQAALLTSEAHVLAPFAFQFLFALAKMSEREIAAAAAKKYILLSMANTTASPLR